MIKKWFLFIPVLILIGCATTGPVLSPMQIRSITIKHIEGSYENIYRATISVMQDQVILLKILT